MKANTPRRAGLVLVTILVLVTVLTMLLTAMTLHIVRQRRVILDRERAVQAEWLARAGIEHAAARLLVNPSPFTEENLKLLADAKVRITAEQSGKDTFTVTAEAIVGGNDEPSVVRTVITRFQRADSGGIRLQAIPMEKLGP